MSKFLMLIFKIDVKSEDLLSRPINNLS